MGEHREYKRHIVPFKDYFKDFKRTLSKYPTFRNQTSIKDKRRILRSKSITQQITTIMTQEELKAIGCSSIDEMITEDFGELGTPERDQFELSCDAFIIGERLKLERQKAGMTQEQLAQKIGTKKSFISRVENGRTDIQLSTLSRIFNGLGKRVAVSLL